MNSFTIKDLENLSGIKAHTIRIWEQRYHFLKPQRTTTNIRYYSNEELKTLLDIALLNKYGFKISHIAKMNAEEIAAKSNSLNDIHAIRERTVNLLVQHMVDLDMVGFENLLSSYIDSKGTELAVIQVIYPFLEKIGLLWYSGHMNAAQEHLVTNIIRQKLIVGIEHTISHKKIEKTVLLFLPEGEHHELGLLFMYFILKSRGATTIYLGPNVPLPDVEHVVNDKKPDLVFLHLIATSTSFNFDKFLAGVQQRLRHIDTIIAGEITQSYKKSVPPFIQFKKSLAEAMEYVSSL